MKLVLLATIALLLALVAGGTVWIVWSIAENIAVKRRKKIPNANEAIKEQS